MKILLYLAAFGLMIYALIEQTKEQPNIYIQVIAVAVFFVLMRNLMNKTPSNFENKPNNEKYEERD